VAPFAASEISFCESLATLSRIPIRIGYVCVLEGGWAACILRLLASVESFIFGSHVHVHEN
jgi:hypothetical protein